MKRHSAQPAPLRLSQAPRLLCNLPGADTTRVQNRSMAAHKSSHAPLRMVGSNKQQTAAPPIMQAGAGEQKKKLQPPHLHGLRELGGRGVQRNLDGLHGGHRSLLAGHLHTQRQWWRQRGRQGWTSALHGSRLGGRCGGPLPGPAGSLAAGMHAVWCLCGVHCACTPRTLLSSVPKRRDTFRRRAGASAAAAAGLATRPASDSASSAATSTAAARSGASRGCCCCTRAPLPRAGAAARKGCTCTRATLQAAILPSLWCNAGGWRRRLWRAPPACYPWS